MFRFKNFKNFAASFGQQSVVGIEVVMVVRVCIQNLVISKGLESICMNNGKLIDDLAMSALGKKSVNRSNRIL